MKNFDSLLVNTKLLNMYTKPNFSTFISMYSDLSFFLLVKMYKEADNYEESLSVL